MHTKSPPQKTTPRDIVAQILLLASGVYMVYVMSSGSGVMRASFDPSTFKQRYEQSQWVVPGSKKPIGDEWLYAYASYRYMQGDSPTSINPEVPPVGKYVIGLGIMTLHNYQATSAIAAALCLVLLFAAVRMSTVTMLPAAIAVFLTSFHPLFADQIEHSPQLDIFQLLFILGFIVCFQLSEKRKSWRWIVASGICLGLFLGTKLFLIFFALSVGWLAVYVVLTRQFTLRTLARYGMIVGVALATFIVSYAMFFVRGGTPQSFLGAQKWIYQFYAQSGIMSHELYGAYIPLVFANRWKVWGDQIRTVQYEHWTIQWPVIALLGILSGILLRKDTTSRRRTLYLMTVSFTVAYAILLFFIPVFPRYLLLLFVPMHILIALFFDTIVQT